MESEPSQIISFYKHRKPIKKLKTITAWINIKENTYAYMWIDDAKNKYIINENDPLEKKYPNDDKSKDETLSGLALEKLCINGTTETLEKLCINGITETLENKQISNSSGSSTVKNPDELKYRIQLSSLVELLKWIDEPDTKKNIKIFTNGLYAVNCIQEWIDKWKRSDFMIDKDKERPNADLLRYICKIKDNNVISIKLLNANEIPSDIHL